MLPHPDPPRRALLPRDHQAGDGRVGVPLARQAAGERPAQGWRHRLPHGGRREPLGDRRPHRAAGGARRAARRGLERREHGRVDGGGSRCFLRAQKEQLQALYDLDRRRDEESTSVGRSLADLDNTISGLRQRLQELEDPPVASAINSTVLCIGPVFFEPSGDDAEGLTTVVQRCLNSRSGRNNAKVKKIVHLEQGLLTTMNALRFGELRAVVLVGSKDVDPTRVDPLWEFGDSSFRPLAALDALIDGRWGRSKMAAAGQDARLPRERVCMYDQYGNFGEPFKMELWRRQIPVFTVSTHEALENWLMSHRLKEALEPMDASVIAFHSAADKAVDAAELDAALLSDEDEGEGEGADADTPPDEGPSMAREMSQSASIMQMLRARS